MPFVILASFYGTPYPLRMNHDPILLCTATLVLLGVSLGWYARFLLLIASAFVAIIVASVFEPSDLHVFKFILVAALFDTAVNCGFLVGLFTRRGGDF